MKKASEYRMHARECRDLAARMDSGEQREQLLAMAKHWEDLANDRAALLVRDRGIPDEADNSPEAPRNKSH